MPPHLHLPNWWICYFTWPSGLLEKAMAPHSSTLAWQILWTEEPGRLQSMESLRVRHNWATSLSLFTFMHWRRKWQPTPVFLPGESQDGGAWWAAIYGVTQSQTRLKQLNNSIQNNTLYKKYSDMITFLFVTLMWRVDEVGKWEQDFTGEEGMVSS